MTPQQKQLILALFAYAAQRDIETADLSKASGIDALTLLKDSHYVVEPNEFNHLWTTAANLCNDKLFGLHFGESLQLAALGVVGEIIKTSETVGQALTICGSLTPLITNAITIHVRYDSLSVCVTFKRTGEADDETTRHITDFVMAFTILELDGLLFRKVRPIQVTLPYSSTANEYARVLRCTPLEGTHYEIVFEASFWDEPIITGNYDVQKPLLENLEVNADGSKTFQVKVMEFLAKNAYLKIYSLEEVAGNFNMTPRSLQRRLQEESTSFQQIADAVRKSIALRYLESGKYKMKEISSILGYNEVSAFSRAFKRWTGRAPMEYFS